jgi:hypothetical protein
MHVIQSIAKTLIFSTFGLVALGVTAWICRDLIEQPAIMAVILTAACLAAVGPAYVAYFWRNGAKPVSMAVLWLTVLASIVLAYTETSYWSSSIEGMHEQATVEKTARDGQALVTNKRQERYANLANGQTPEQIQAKIEAKAVDAKFARSNGCAAATLGNSRVFCAEYFALKAELAAATEARNLESTVWASGTKEEPFLKRNFYQAAMLGSQNLGGTVSAWILGICLVLVVFLGSLLHLGFLIASSPVKRAAARTATKAPEAPSLPLKVFPPLAPRTALPERPIPGYLTGKAPVEPDPTPPGDAAPTIEPKPEPKPAAGPVLVDENWKPSGKPKKLSKSERYADIDAPTRDWLNTGRAVPVALSLGSSGPDVWDAFNAYCLAQHPPIKPLNPSHLGRSLRRVGVASRKTSKGVTYALRLVKMPMKRAA